MMEAQVQESAQAQKAKGKETNAFVLVSTEIENLTKTKALNWADKLVEDIDANSFRLGGVLKVIYDNSWYEGYETFGGFVGARFGFQERKARYLMEIYDNLVTKQIPWEKVEGLGWTKLKDLARVLTLDNVDEWVEKAKGLTVIELQTLLKGESGGGDKTAETSSDAVKMKFTLKADQVETVQAALAKAKAETGTEHDSVALEMICTGYLGGAISTGQDLQGLMQSAGWEKVLEIFDQMFPQVDLTVGSVGEATAG